MTRSRLSKTKSTSVTKKWWFVGGGIGIAVAAIIIISLVITNAINTNNAASSSTNDIPGIDTSNRAVRIDDTATNNMWERFLSLPVLTTHPIQMQTPHAMGNAVQLSATNATVASTLGFTSVDQLACTNGTARIFYGFDNDQSTYFLFHANGCWYWFRGPSIYFKIPSVYIYDFLAVMMTYH